MAQQNRREPEHSGSTHDFRLESEKLAQRKRRRTLRRILIPALILTALLAYASGVFGASLAAAEDLVDSVRIALMPEAEYPVQTGVSELYQLQEMSGGFVALGEESCVVYAAGGNRLRAIQPGYARPAISVGAHRFVIYNRSGTELRVESRAQTLYTKTCESGILLCEMARGGNLAVVTGHSRYVAELTVYSPLMESLLVWDMIEAEGTPVRLAFSSDGRRLAMATLTASEGRLVSNLYLLNTKKEGETLLATVYDAVPMGLEWRSSGELLLLYDDHAAVYSASTGEETARYEFDNAALTGWSAQSKSTALLFRSGGASRLVLLDETLTPVADRNIPRANGVTLTRTAVYVLTDSAVECFSAAGEYQWSKADGIKPLAVLDAKQLLLFEGNSVSVLSPPEE